MTDELRRLLKRASPDTQALNADLLAGDKRKPAAATTGSPLAAQFETLWRHLGGPELKPEFRFALPDRQWRFDYCHLATRTAIELEGGVHSRGRHTRGKGYIEDCHKYNAAAQLGYTVFRLATGMVTYDNLTQIIEHIDEVMRETDNR